MDTFLNMVGLSLKSQLLHGFHSDLFDHCNTGPSVDLPFKTPIQYGKTKAKSIRKGTYLVSLLPILLPANVWRCQGNTACCVAYFQLMEDKQINR